MNRNPIIVIALLFLLTDNGRGPGGTLSPVSGLRLEALLDGVKQASNVLDQISSLSSTLQKAPMIPPPSPELGDKLVSNDSLDLQKLMDMAGPILSTFNALNPPGKE